MWTQFILASLTTVLVLYLPGYLFWRAFRFERMMATCTAPLASIAGLGIIGIVFERAGVPATAVTVGSTLMAICVLALLVSVLVGKVRKQAGNAILDYPADRSATQEEGRRNSKLDWAILGAAVVCGLIVTGFVFLASIGSPEAFYSRWDNQIHVSYVRAFLDSQTWSSLVASPYLGVPEYAKAHLVEPEFYPAALHEIMAFVCSATGVSVPCSMNAVNAMFAGVVIPVSMISFIKAAFPESVATHAAGIVTASICSVFPWWLFIAGPLYPNFAGTTLIPASAACAIALLKNGLALRKLPSTLMLGACSIAALGLMQPNTVFFLFVVLASYGASHLYHFVDEKTAVRTQDADQDGNHPRPALNMRAIGAVALYTVCLVLFWTACLHAPFLESVVEYEVGVDDNVLGVIITTIGMPASEPLFFIAVVAGIVICCRKRCFWVLVPALFMGISYIAASCWPETIGRFLVGFWYTDTRRIGPSFGFTLVPLAACGLGALIEAIMKPRKKDAGPSRSARLGISCAIAAAFFGLTLFPTFTFEAFGDSHTTGFGMFRDNLYEGYNPEIDHVYSAKEIAFTNKVRDTIGTEPLVLNMPHDGSGFAYGVTGLNGYYRLFGTGYQTDDAKIIRKNLYRYATNDNVKAAVKRTGAQYVLLLDYQVPFEEGFWFGSRYTDPDVWKGLNSITDETPGFSVVLSEDDMRLYKIEDVA